MDNFVVTFARGFGTGGKAIKNKNDGSYWICGEGVGTEQKTVSGETEYTVTCSSKFVPYEFPANEFSK